MSIPNLSHNDIDISLIIELFKYNNNVIAKYHVLNYSYS